MTILNAQPRIRIRNVSDISTMSIGNANIIDDETVTLFSHSITVQGTEHTFIRFPIEIFTDPGNSGTARLIILENTEELFNDIVAWSGNMFYQNTFIFEKINRPGTYAYSATIRGISSTTVGGQATNMSLDTASVDIAAFGTMS